MNGFAYTRTFPLRRGYEVEFCLEGGQIEVRWLPDIPPAKIGRKLLPAYRGARNAFFASLGVPMVVVDL